MTDSPKNEVTTDDTSKAGPEKENIKELEEVSKNEPTAPTDEREDSPKDNTTLGVVSSPIEPAVTNADHKERPVASPSMSITRLTHSLDQPLQSTPSPEAVSNISQPSRDAYRPPTYPSRHQNYDPRDNNARIRPEYGHNNGQINYPPPPPNSQRPRDYSYEAEAHSNPYVYVPPQQQQHTYLPGNPHEINNGYQQQFAEYQNHNGRHPMHPPPPHSHGYYHEQQPPYGPGAYGPGLVQHPPVAHYAAQNQGSEVMYTDDAATKLNDRIKRRCFNCCSTDTSTWRRSNLHAGKVLCNKCGLFERTHARSRPEQFPHRRGPLITATLGGRSPPSSHAQQKKHQSSAPVEGNRSEPMHGHPSSGMTLPSNVYNQPHQEQMHLPPYSTLSNGTAYSNAHHVSPYSYSPYQQPAIPRQNGHGHGYHLDPSLPGQGQENVYREGQHNHSPSYPLRMTSRDSPRQDLTDEPRHLPPLPPLQAIPDFADRAPSRKSSTPDSRTLNEDQPEDKKSVHAESPLEMSIKGERSRTATPVIEK